MISAPSIRDEGLKTVTTITAVAVAICAAAYLLDNPMLIAAAGLAPLAGLVAWTQPFIVCSLFIAFSYFRLPEAYPLLASAKPALLLGTAAVSLVAAQALLSPLRQSTNARTLKVMCLLSLVASVGLSVPFSFLRSSGSVGLDPVLIPATMLAAAFCAGVWTLLLSAASERPLPINIWLFAAFYILICITTILSQIPGNSYDWWSSITWKVAAMTLATVWLTRSDRDLLNASNIFIMSGVLISAVVVYNKIYSLSLVQGTRVSIGRIASEDPELVNTGTSTILSDPNDLALILMFPLAFALARVVYRRNLIEGILAAFVCALIITSIVFTQSRGAALGVIAVLAVVLLRRYRSIVPGLMALLIAAPILLAAMNIATRASGGYDEMSEGGLDESAQHRVDAWKTAIKMAAQRPLSGVGISNFPHLYFSYTDYWRNRAIAVHSMWFQVLGELGWLGLALFVGMIWTSFSVNGLSIRRLEKARAPPVLRATGIALQAALAGTCASGTFLSQAHTWPVYIIVALIAALAKRTDAWCPQVAPGQSP